MKFCKNCLQPDTRPATFFLDGVCPACRYSKSINNKNYEWDIRLEILQKIFSQFKQHSHYDCIIGVSGGKDSTRQAVWIKEKLKKRPLLVTLSYPPEQITNLGAKNLSNLISLGFDHQVISLQPQTWKKLLKIGFTKYGNWAKASEQALISAVPILANKLKIPLILWGENPSIQLGDMKTSGKHEWDGNNLKNLNTAQGCNIEWMIDYGFNKHDILNYEFPKKNKFNNTQIIYLGWFWDDWSLKSNGLSALLRGLERRKESFKKNQDMYGLTALDEDWVILNQMIKYYKYGFGRVTDYVNEEIRNQKISRSEGIEIIERYDGSCSDHCIESFCRYINISNKKFWSIVSSFVNKDLFEIKFLNTKSKPIILKKFKVGYDL